MTVPISSETSTHEWRGECHPGDGTISWSSQDTRPTSVRSAGAAKARAHGKVLLGRAPLSLLGTEAVTSAGADELSGE